MEYAKGLVFTAVAKGVRINNGVNRMWINGKTTITIPNAKAGDIVEVTYANSGDGSMRIL